MGSWVANLQDASAAAALAWLALTGLVYLVIFAFDHRRAAHGWLAMQALCAACLPLAALGLTRSVLDLHQASVLGVAVPLSCLASVYYTHSCFELPKPSLGWPALTASALVVELAGAAAGVSPGVSRVTTGVVVAITIGYQIATLGQLARRASAVNAATMTFAWVALAASAGLDAIGVTRGMASLGVSAFALLQTLAMARLHLGSMHQAERLRDELAAKLVTLEARNQEIEYLNDELRRQIGLRSRQLAGALSRLADTDAARAELLPGQIVAQRYEVITSLGAGAMGRVYKVARLSDRQPLALKVLLAGGDREAASRLAREAQILAELDHPNLVAIRDIDIDDAGRIFLVMELIEGTTLAAIGVRNTDLQWSLWVVRELASGLAAMHAEGIVHRDLKPANVLVTSTAVKIADFGLSSLVGASPTPRAAPALTHPLATPQWRALTQTGIIMGTPRYMAPELAEHDRDASPATDVYSFGLVALELLTGQHAFEEPPFARRLAGEPVPPPLSLMALRPDLDLSIASLLQSCLAADPAERPTAAAIDRVLGFLTSMPAALPPPRPTPSVASRLRPYDPSLN